jgi:hypothetical protein
MYETKTFKYNNMQESAMTHLSEPILENMLSYLTELYLRLNKYPHKIQGFYDVPCPDYSLTINSKEELYGRMKQLGQLLNAKAMTVRQDNTEITVELI